MDVFEAIHSRRSIRKYRPDPVDRALLEELLYAAVQAPTPPVSGTIPWALCVIEGVERLANYGNRAKQYADDHQPEGRPWTWTERPDFKVFWGALRWSCFALERATRKHRLIAVAPRRTSCLRRMPAQWLPAELARLCPGFTAQELRKNLDYPKASNLLSQSSLAIQPSNRSAVLGPSLRLPGVHQSERQAYDRVDGQLQLSSHGRDRYTVIARVDSAATRCAVVG